MRSPFPGMDPYLERHWRDIHARLVLYSCDQVEEQLPSNLIARVEERVILEPEEGDHRGIYPDVRVVEHKRRGESGAVAVLHEVVTAEPVVVRFEKATETFIRILEKNSKTRLITVIEFLSPSNKLPGDSQDEYVQKQRELLASRVSLVEIDLLRAGKRVLGLGPNYIPRRVWTTYQACVRRGWSPSRCEFYRIPLAARLPAIRIPLRKKDADIRLDLQALVDQAYRKGRYHRTLDYSASPEPPLEGPEAKWAESLLKAHRRTARGR